MQYRLIGIDRKTGESISNEWKAVNDFLWISWEWAVFQKVADNIRVELKEMKSNELSSN